MISKINLTNINKIKRPIVFLPMAVDFLHHGHIRIIKKASKYASEKDISFILNSLNN